MASKTGHGRSGNTSNRGFASMDQAKQREIARKGGQSVAPEDRTFSKNPELAAEAGRKGGQNVDSAARSSPRIPSSPPRRAARAASTAMAAARPPRAATGPIAEAILPKNPSMRPVLVASAARAATAVTAKFPKITSRARSCLRAAVIVGMPLSRHAEFGAGRSDY